MTDLRAAVEGMRSQERSWQRDRALDAVLALIPEGAVLVTEEGLARALHQEYGTATDHTGPVCTACHEDAAAILRHLRETP